MTAWTRGTRRLVTARPWLSGAVAVVLIGGGIAAYVWTGGSSGTAASAQATTRLVSVTSGTVRQSVSTTGTLTPADEEDVSFGSAAEITSVRVTQGDKVTKGQVLGTIATLALKSTLAQAKAQLASTKATLASDEDSTSTTSAQLTADKAAVSTASSSVTDAKTALTDATLRSPISGTVAEVNVTKGDQSSGSSGSSTSTSGTGATGSTTGSAGGSGAGSAGGANSGSGTGSTGGSTTTSSSSSGDFVVVGMKKWTVAATVDDTEVGLITKGDQAQITTDNVTGTVFGVVSSVSVLSSSSSGSASYPVEIAVTGTPSGLHDGASATVAITYKQATNVLTVPTLAVHRDTNSSYVYVAKNGTKTKTTIKTGLASGGTTQITSGLTSGQQVYVDVPAAATNRTGTGTQTTRTGRTGYYPGGGGNYPGGYGGGGNFPARNGAGAAGGNP